MHRWSHERPWRKTPKTSRSRVFIDDGDARRALASTAPLDRRHNVKKTLAITVTTLVAVALAATAALFALSAFAGAHRTCGKVDPAELRAAADPQYAQKLAKLARCGY
jgi:hypothetical protein